MGELCNSPKLPHVPLLPAIPLREGYLLNSPSHMEAAAVDAYLQEDLALAAFAYRLRLRPPVLFALRC